MKPVQDRLWTAEETAAYLQIPKATLYQWERALDSAKARPSAGA
jgi:hypothetical protein